MQELPKSVIIILGASLFLLVMTAFVIILLMAYKKRDRSHVMEKKRLSEEFRNQLLQSQIEVQEQTFQQIGKELHDNVGQLLSTSRMLIGLAERSLETPPDALLTANATIGEAISEIRSLSKSLDKDWLEQFDFVQNLKTEVTRINAGNVMQASFSGAQILNISSSKRIILFRIVQEAIQNAVKHSGCKNIKIMVSNENGNVGIVIQDDGKGFEYQDVKMGMGLSNIRHRTGLLNGSVQYNSARGKGTSIVITIPEKEGLQTEV